jgi:hypothetical protein
MKKIFFIMILWAIFFAVNAQSITYIDLVHPKFEEIPANRIFEKVEYIPLETPKEALLKLQLTTYYLTDKYIIAVASLRAAYLFDRKTGRFIREISSRGQGPDEYAFRILYNYSFDEKNNLLYADDGGKNYWKCINIQTNKVEFFMKRPLTGKDNKSFYIIHAPWRISTKSDRYISFCNNITGKDTVKLVVHDKEGNIIKKFRNYLEYEKISVENPEHSGIFYTYDKKTYFKEFLYNDTVFCVDENNVSPHIIFNLGKKQPSYYYREERNYNRGKILITFVHETDFFVTFNYYIYKENLAKVDFYTGYYDKKSTQTYVSLHSNKKAGYTTPDGLPVNFFPTYNSEKGELIGEIDPEELLKYKNNISPKYRQMFKDLREDDNPIVVIGTLKK